MKNCLVLLAVLAIAVAAQEGCDMHPQSGTQLFPICMTRYSTPLKLGGVIGVSINHFTGWDMYRGPFFQIEPGFGGGKLNAGYRFGANHFMPLWNVGLSASVMQTWGNPLGDVEPDQTYLGVELSCAMLVLGLNGGAFRHIAGNDEEHKWIYTLGVGAGF
jgi:hypothetical protein